MMLTAVLLRFAADEAGATAMEYALLATLIGIGLVTTFALVGDTVVNLFGVGSGGAGDVINAQALKVN